MKKRNGIHKFLRILFIYIPLWFVIISVSIVIVLKWVPVYITPLMVVRSIEHFNDDTYHIYKTWRPLEELSPNIGCAVMAGEDNRFLTHSGFDLKEINKALDAKKRGRKLRGASTISQQTAKNVFLFPSRSWVRKGFEAYYTCLIELIWGKRRIMEVYLNVAEMGRGLFGVEAAAERLFHTRAARLNARQAALIAATLPSPIKRHAESPSTYVRKRAAQIQRLMYYMPYPRKKWHEK
jgi:monofunctional glycosyltransferase